ncbi:MAG: IclR family transcriptional regulator [Synergistales bacterium]
MTGPGRKEQILDSVLRTFSIVELLAKKGELGVTGIAEEVAMDKSSVYRILATLKRIGYVCQNPSNRKYSNTSKFARLGSPSIELADLRDRAHRVLAAMAEEAGEAASLGVLEGRDILYIDTIQCSGLIRVNLPIGQKLPAYCSALGKAILAFMIESEVVALFGDEPFWTPTPRTVASCGALLPELRIVRAQGFARDLEESNPELSCLGAPIFGADGKVLAGISISFPRFRYPEQHDAERKMVPLLLEAAASISRDLGYQDPARASGKGK